MEDKLKFKDSVIFKEYKEEISRNKERYKPVLLELLEEDKIDEDIYKDIINIWEKEWKEEANVNIDILKFNRYWGIFSEYKEEIVKNKKRYKPIVLRLLEKYKLSEYIYEDIIKLWEKEWKEEPSIEIDKLKFRDYRVFKEYKKEIKRDKERYKLALLKAVEENIEDILGDLYLSPSVVRLWEKEWKEEPNVEIDKLIFGGWDFDEDYEEYLNFDGDYELDYENDEDDEYYNYEQALRTKQLIENPKRYKPALLKLLEENIDSIISDIFLCPSVIRLWEWEWKEEPNIYIDELKFWNEDAFYDFEDEIIANPERYKPILINLILTTGATFDTFYNYILDEWRDKELGI